MEGWKNVAMVFACLSSCTCDLPLPALGARLPAATSACTVLLHATAMAACEGTGDS